MAGESARDPFAVGEGYPGSELAMWIFLVTEILLFGGFFLMYVVYRLDNPQAFIVGSGHLDVVLGTVNTVILMTSSLTMVLAVDRVARRPDRAAWLLAATWLLGAAFLAVKAVEYRHELTGGLPAETPGQRGFFWLYFSMTGLHALHLVSGLGVVGYYAVRLWRAPGVSALPRQVRIAGLYWHLVDVLWLFIYPLFYLVERHAQLH